MSGRENFPLPVIVGQLANEQGSCLFSLIDLEDGFHQMHLEEDSKHFTAFCSPFGVFGWSVLRMGVKVGPVGYQQMVQHITRNCPSSKPYIDNIMSPNKKEILDPQKTNLAEQREPRTLRKYFHAPTKKLCPLCDVLASAQITIKPEKCHLFKKRVQYVGHISKVANDFRTRPKRTQCLSRITVLSPQQGS